MTAMLAPRGHREVGLADSTADRLTYLRQIRDARRNWPGYAANVAEIEAEIAQLEAEAEHAETAERLGIVTDA